MLRVAGHAELHGRLGRVGLPLDLDVLGDERLLDEVEPLLLRLGRDGRVLHLGVEELVEPVPKDLHRDRRLGLEVRADLTVDRERVRREL